MSISKLYVIFSGCNFADFTLIAFIFLFTGMLFACILSSYTTVYAQQLTNFDAAQKNASIAGNISVTGIANSKVKPDTVVVSLGVETTNKTASAALAKNSNIMNKVLHALKTSGVKENETSTSSFSISPNYNNSESSGSADRIKGFTASNSIQIESTNLNNVSKWIDASIEAGANTVNNIDFILSDKKLEEIKTSLIKQAIEDARTKVNSAASALGFKVVGVKSINLGNFGIQPPPIPLAKESVATVPAGSISTPIISGQEQVNVSVDIVFLVLN